MRVGCVEYINALPITLPFQLSKIENDVEFVYAIPSELNSLLRNKELDIALTSSVEYLEGDYQLLPGFGIAGRQNILSVNLYTQLPIAYLSGRRVGLTHHSATSIELLKVLCRHLWKIEPHFEPLNRKEDFSDYAACLLIGDEALENLCIPHFQTIDLGSAWYSLTGLPFVFAVFVVRQEVDLQKLTAFQKQLAEALKWSDSHREIVEEEAKKNCSLPAELIHQYYSVLQHRLGEREMEGLKKFKNFWFNNLSMNRS